MKTIRYYLLAALTALGAAACEHKELCYDHRHDVELEVVFDWQNDPDADPATMDLYLIPENGGSASRYQFPNRNGGRITVPLGRYHAFGINSDSETNVLRGKESWNTFEVYTVDASLLSALGVRAEEPPRAEGTEDERVAYTPDRLWTADRQTLAMTDPERSYKITLYPDNRLCNYTVTIRNAENLKHIRGLSGSLSSLAGGLMVADASLTEERVTMSFGAQSDGESTVTAAFHTLGHCPTLPNPHKLVIYAVLADNSKWYYTYDVTDQIHNAPDPRNVAIVLDGLPLPKPIVNGGGFQPDVNDWEDGDRIEIEM